MFWGVFRRLFVLICVYSFICSFVCASEFDYNKYREAAVNQEDFSGYMRTLQGKIQKNWNPPDFAEDGDATVTFRINRQGEIVSREITESSNNPVFDESTLEALRKAAPFDKFPANTSKQYLTIKYNFHTSIVKTDTMKEYVRNADRFFNVNNETALSYIDLAIKEVEGDIGSYFLYGKRSKIKRALGDIEGAEQDLQECKRLKAKFDQKRIMSSKLIAEMENSPFAYFYLAHSYEIAGDYVHALEAIDKAIQLTELNNQYKRYRAELLEKSNL